MAFWWVNHKQTFTKEFEGGYIWSPKVNKNGSYNQAYTNLTLTQVGDVVFSYAGTFIRAVSVVEEDYIEAAIWFCLRIYIRPVYTYVIFQFQLRKDIMCK